MQKKSSLGARSAVYACFGVCILDDNAILTMLTSKNKDETCWKCVYDDGIFRLLTTVWYGITQIYLGSIQYSTPPLPMTAFANYIEGLVRCCILVLQNHNHATTITRHVEKHRCAYICTYGLVSWFSITLTPPLYYEERSPALHKTHSLCRIFIPSCPPYLPTYLH